MLVNISQACKLAGISRTVFYQNYINKGKISTGRDNRNRPMVDTSEILRVFGSLQNITGLTDQIEQGITQGDTTPEHLTHTPNTDFIARLATLEAENRHLAERLAETRATLTKTEEEARDREQWQRGQIEKLTDTVRMIEAPKTAPSQPAPATKSLFARLFGG